jgi:hypothetical protein
MTKIKYLVIVIAVVVTSASAWQSKAQNKETDHGETGTWSIGAGLQFLQTYPGSWSGFGSLASLAGPDGWGCSSALYYPSSYIPKGHLLIEYGLSHRLNLMFLASGSYSKPEGDEGPEFSGFGISAGVRWLFNPQGRVQISGFGLISYHGFWVTDSDTRNEYDSNGNLVSSRTLSCETNSYNVGAGLGLAFEIGLLDNLHLRFSSQFLKATYDHGEAVYKHDEVVDNKDTSNSFSARLEFSPTIELRMLF